MNRRADEQRAVFWARMHGGTIELPVRLFVLICMLLIAGGALLGEFTASLGGDSISWRRLVGAAAAFVVAAALLSNRVGRSKTD